MRIELAEGGRWKWFCNQSSAGRSYAKRQRKIEMANTVSMSTRTAKGKARLITQGATSIGYTQTMTWSRKRLAAGSIAGDWSAVGGDLRLVMAAVRRELTSA